MNYPNFRAALAPLVLLSAIALTACTDRSAEEAGRKLDVAAADAKAEAQKAGDRIEKKSDEAVAAIKEAGADMKQSAKETTADAKRAMSDAAITASIRVDVAKDPGLSNLKIEVDTLNGVVTLRGETTNADARSRAGNVARNISGVVSVNNEIKVLG